MVKFRELKAGDKFTLEGDDVVIYEKVKLGSCSCSKENAVNTMTGVFTVIKDNTKVKKHESK